MGTSAVAPAIDHQKLSGWKRLFINAAGFGAGFAFVLACVMGVGLWWMSRPKPPQQWNKNAITATFETSTLSTKGSVFLAIDYIFENHTDKDFHGPKQWVTMRRMENSDALEQDVDLGYTDLFIPPHQKTKFELTRSFNFDTSYNGATISEKESDDLKNLQKFMFKQLSPIKSFVLFDEDSRYQVELPSGWKNIKPE